MCTLQTRKEDRLRVNSYTFNIGISSSKSLRNVAVCLVQFYSTPQKIVILLLFSIYFWIYWGQSTVPHFGLPCFYTCLKHLWKRNYHLHLPYQPKCVYITKGSTTLPSVLSWVYCWRIWNFNQRNLLHNLFAAHTYLPYYSWATKKGFKNQYVQKIPISLLLGPT